MWPTWDQAAMLVAAMLVVVALTRRSTNHRVLGLSAAAAEVVLVAFLYGIWRLARMLPLTQESGAIDRGHQIWDLERQLHIGSELAIQRWTLDHGRLAEWATTYYAYVHVPALLGFLVWLWVRHREAYPRWRNALAIVTGFCLVIRFWRVAPPRFLPDLGFVDTSVQYGVSVYGSINHGVSDQFAAMPSIHIAWAAVVAFGIIDASPSRWRWLALVHLVLTSYVVVATANHWWMDGIVAIALLGLALAIDEGVRRWWVRRGSRGALRPT